MMPPAVAISPEPFGETAKGLRLAAYRYSFCMVAADFAQTNIDQNE